MPAMRIKFKGYQSDVELSCQMFEILLSAVDRLRREYFKELGASPTPVLNDIFNMAAITEISYRLASMTIEREQLMTDEESGTSLIVVKGNAVTAYYGEPPYKSEKVDLEIQTKEEQKAYLAGSFAGRNVEITKQID